jgi:hypothetical protein
MIHGVMSQSMSPLRFTTKRAVRSALSIVCLAAIVAGGGTYVQVISRNQVNCSTNQVNCPTGFVRFEPSSSLGSTWVSSWAQYDETLPFPPTNGHGFTSAWGGPWIQPFEHTLNGDPTGDLYLNFNATQGRHNLVMLDIGQSAPCALAFRISTDAYGTDWNPPVVVTSVADYPSVASAPIGPMGTIVIGEHQRLLKCIRFPGVRLNGWRRTLERPPNYGQRE